MSTGADFFADTGVGVDVGYFADADDVAAGFDDFLQNGGRGGRNGVVVAVAGAFEICRAVANEWPGDDAADGQVAVIENLAGGFTEVVEFLKTEGLLMTRDLQNTVSGGVENRCATAPVFFAKPCDDLSAGGMAVAEATADAGFPGDPVE